MIIAPGRAYLIQQGIDERLIFGPRAGDGMAIVRDIQKGVANLLLHLGVC